MRLVPCSSVGATLMFLLMACGAPEQRPEATPSESVPAPSTASAVEVNGDASAPVNQLAIGAITDLEQWWGRQYPDLYGEEYRPVSGGFFAVRPSAGEVPPCLSAAGDAVDNAYYCVSADVVAWDAENLFPDLQSRFGDLVIPVVMAHEWGHAIQARSGFTARTVTRELQADCFAGAWTKHAQQDGVFDISDADLDRALAGILDLRDAPGVSQLDPNAHGSGFDRVSAFWDGYGEGLQRCESYRDDDPIVFQLPFGTADDLERRGNTSYEAVVNGAPRDLDDYWRLAYPELTSGQPWQPVGLEPFDPSAPPPCGGRSTGGFALFYCEPDDYIGWDNVNAMPGVYRQAGDFAVATMLATQYGLAALTRLGDESDEMTSTLRSDCLAGSYASSVILNDRPETSTFQISPGDLDEAIKALLLFRGEGDVERQGSGFERVRAFREGVLYGADPCPTFRG